MHTSNGSTARSFPFPPNNWQSFPVAVDKNGRYYLSLRDGYRGTLFTFNISSDSIQLCAQIEGFVENFALDEQHEQLVVYSERNVSAYETVSCKLKWRYTLGTKVILGFLQLNGDGFSIISNGQEIYAISPFGELLYHQTFAEVSRVKSILLARNTIIYGCGSRITFLEHMGQSFSLSASSSVSVSSSVSRSPSPSASVSKSLPPSSSFSASPLPSPLVSPSPSPSAHGGHQNDKKDDGMMIIIIITVIVGSVVLCVIIGGCIFSCYLINKKKKKVAEVLELFEPWKELSTTEAEALMVFDVEENFLGSGAYGTGSVLILLFFSLFFVNRRCPSLQRRMGTGSSSYQKNLCQERQNCSH